MESGWSLKHLHRLIVSSATYRQSSRVTPELLARDPYNRLLARGPRLRVDAELVRDIALAASGLLDRKVGGESVYPPAPAFLFQPPASYGPKTWAEATGPGPLSPGPLHVPLPLGALPDAPDLRRPQRRLLLRPPHPVEHAAPGPDLAQRAGLPGMRPGPGPADLEGRGRHRPRSSGATPSAAAWAASRRREESAPLLVAAAPRDETVRRPGRPIPGSWPSTSPRRPSACPPTPRPPSSPAGRSSPASC